MRTMIGTVASIEGQVEVVDGRGQHRMLAVGDLLREGDQVVTTAGSVLSLATITGDAMQFSGQQAITMTTQLTSQYAADASDDAIHPWLLQQVLASVQSGQDVLDLSALLSEIPEENTFSAFSATVLPEAEQGSSLNIEDLIQDHATAQPLATEVGGMADLMASTGLPSEVALQQSLLNDLIKDS
ncbi:retention module-containing protein [Methylophilus sp.]|uniref:retention module-containing protein n=1 Tax=Methylophilus sp. TaxID=29541 RepID=UPI0025798582|nr:retention module-containing protein [Methylophilus sp.]